MPAAEKLAGRSVRGGNGAVLCRGDPGKRGFSAGRLELAMGKNFAFGNGRSGGAVFSAAADGGAFYRREKEKKIRRKKRKVKNLLLVDFLSEKEMRMVIFSTKGQNI